MMTPTEAEENIVSLIGGLAEIEEDIKTAQEIIDNAMSNRDWKEVISVASDLIEMDIERDTYARSIDFFKGLPGVKKRKNMEDRKPNMYVLQTLNKTS